MNSGQDAQSDTDHTQTETPYVHRINVMENPETKTAEDKRGDYTKASTVDSEKGRVDQQKMEKHGQVGGNGAGRNTEPGGANKKNRGHEQMNKGDCFTTYKKLLIVIFIILIFLVLLFLGLFIDARCKLAKIKKSGTSGTSAPAPKPTPTLPVPYIPGAIIEGTIQTAENYSTALGNSSSLAYKKLENRFIAAVMYFYASNQSTYIPYYEKTIVTDFVQAGKQVDVNFEVHFSQLDNDNSLPDAHTVLVDTVQARHLRPILVLGGNVRKKEN